MWLDYLRAREGRAPNIMPISVRVSLVQVLLLFFYFLSFCIISNVHCYLDTPFIFRESMVLMG